MSERKKPTRIVEKKQSWFDRNQANCFWFIVVFLVVTILIIQLQCRESQTQNVADEIVQPVREQGNCFCYGQSCEGCKLIDGKEYCYQEICDYWIYQDTHRVICNVNGNMSLCTPDWCEKNSDKCESQLYQKPLTRECVEWEDYFKILFPNDISNPNDCKIQSCKETLGIDWYNYDYHEYHNYKFKTDICLFLTLCKKNNPACLCWSDELCVKETPFEKGKRVANCISNCLEKDVFYYCENYCYCREGLECLK